MLAYIQKKINKKWCTLIQTDAVDSGSVLDHLCEQHCKSFYRISMDKTDNMPAEPQGFSREDALEALYNVKLIELTEKQAIDSFKRIANIIHKMDKWYKH